MNTNVDTSLQLAGCEFVSKQLAKLMKHLQGAKSAEDIEDVHQARVACRRLRSGLAAFSDCFDSAKTRDWNKQIKKLLQSFGAARDLDVQIEFLQEVLDGIDAEHKRNRPGIKRMMLRWQHHRDAVQPAVIKSINRLQKDHVLMNIHLEVERILFELRHLGAPPVTGVIAERAREQIQDRAAELSGRRSCLERPQDIPEHHAMRISAKKLRYTMEIFDAALDGKLRGAIKKVKKIQTILGDLHDCDVWEEDITAFIEQERQRTIDYYGHGRPFARILPGLEYLRQERRQRRGELLTAARVYFEKLEAESFFETFLNGLRGESHPLKQELQHDEQDSEDNTTEQRPSSDNCDSV